MQRTTLQSTRTPPALRAGGVTPSSVLGAAGLRRAEPAASTVPLMGVGGCYVPMLQAKFTVNTPGDKYEQEADRVAEQVMRMPEPRVQRQCACGKGSTESECPECRKKKHEASGKLQRVASSPVGGMTAPPIVNDVLSSSGSPLPTGTRSFMESRFGLDFSHVRVHSNTTAVASAREVGARAYTLGSNIVFGAGEYSPETYNGRALLAHELVHTVQQAGRTSSLAPGKYDQGRGSEQHGLAVQRKPEESKGNKAAAWKGTYADEEAIATELMKKQKLSKPDAQRKAKEIIQQQRQAIETGYPGLKSGKYSWDIYQDVVIGQDRKIPNCFGDVCKGGKERWEPDHAELNAWLKGNKFSSSGCGCKCGEQAVATYVIHLRYTRGASTSVETISQPFHIAEQLEDCVWRSRLGDLGVIFHESPQQLESTLAAETIAKEWAKAASLNFVSAKMELTCYSAKHSRKDYHGPPKGPLKCVKTK